MAYFFKIFALMLSQPEAFDGSSDFRALNTSSSEMSISLMFNGGVSISEEVGMNCL